MKRIAMIAASGLMALLPSVASARPHFFFGFPVPPFLPAFFAPPVVVAPDVTVAAPAVCPAPAVTVAPPVVYAPAPVPVFSYYTSYPTPYYHHVYVHPAVRHYRVVRYHR
jgi:hypothetical protein